MAPAITLVEDEPEVREAIAGLLRDEGFPVTTLGTLDALERRAKRGELGQLLLVDLELDGRPAFDAIAEVRRSSPKLPVVALSGHAAASWVLGALAAGCTGYLLKLEPGDVIVRAIHDALDGGAPLSARVASAVLKAVEGRPVSESPLSTAERRVLASLADGATEEEVSARLRLRPARVRELLETACRKLDARTQTAAVAQAMRRGLLR